MLNRIKKILKNKTQKILKPIIFRIPNRIKYGKYYRKFYKKINEIYNLEIEEKREWQLKKIQEIVEYAYFNVPYYRELLDKNKISYKINSFEDFEKIPYLTKEIIRANFNKLKSNENIAYSIVTTGGTTGTPMEFYLDKKIKINELAFLDYYWNKFSSSYKDTAKIVILRQNIPNNEKEWEIVGNKLIMSSFKLNSLNAERYLEKIEKFDPDYIHTFPSTIFLLTEYIIREEKKVKLKNLKGIFSSSETLKDFQRKKIEKIFNVRICDLYGNSERVVMALDNIDEQNKKEYNLLLNYSYVELINNKQKNIILENNKIGEVVATGFWNKSMPLIRYKIGDYAESLGQYDKLKTIVGRKSEYFIDCDNNKVIFTCSDEPFWECKNKIEAYQYIQNKKGKVILKIICLFGYNNKDEEKIIEKLSNLYPRIKFEIKYVSEIKRTKRGKYKYLIQNMKL